MVTGTLPLNQRLEISSAEAWGLWQHATQCLAGVGMVSDGSLSENGKWLVKVRSATHYQYCLPVMSRLGAEAIIGETERELRRLQTLGQNVISHGLVTLGGNEIATVTPYIDNLRKCSYADFSHHVSPRLLQYYQDAAILLPNLYLEDVSDNGQYSRLTEQGEPFLHDVEPYLAGDRSLLNSKISYMSSILQTS